ncbi:hypothetical protein R69749_01291 [Paraburkholderia domus]|nr:hypothetical protein R70006_02428 [Paraburkholderia domus]CAE6772123.1 hypothetical protein R69749_01291 [Paraburkholderia domus]CAE6856682.1 hypothetical protein R70199_00623 [Paraburkholderia domus]CAE6872449.1 hypothetical protein R75471_01059 [Paraburkholderia domus]
MTTAIVVGATGLTGSALVRQLLDDERFTFVRALARRSNGLSHAKFRARGAGAWSDLEWLQRAVRGCQQTSHVKMRSHTAPCCVPLFPG